MSSQNKIRLLPDQFIFKQNDQGDSAYLILSGSLNVERDGVVLGKMTEGEIFGELSLILGEKRQASIKAVVPCELIKISPVAFDELLLSSSLELHKAIRSIAEEIGKNEGYKLPLAHSELTELVKDAPTVVRALALQLHHRLSQMIFS